MGNYKWDNHLHTRQHRLAVLINIGHQYSLVIGANSPLGNVQQHGWFMADTSLSYKQQVEQVKSRVDWVFEAGFDFLTTESGSSEFTHPECNLMLDLLNVYADYVANVWGREAGVKVHCSVGQVSTVLYCIVDYTYNIVNIGVFLNAPFTPSTVLILYISLYLHCTNTVYQSLSHILYISLYLIYTLTVMHRLV